MAISFRKQKLREESNRKGLIFGLIALGVSYLIAKDITTSFFIALAVGGGVWAWVRGS